MVNKKHMTNWINKTSVVLSYVFYSLNYYRIGIMNYFYYIIDERYIQIISFSLLRDWILGGKIHSIQSITFDTWYGTFLYRIVTLFDSGLLPCLTFMMGSHLLSEVCGQYIAMPHHNIHCNISIHQVDSAQ